MRKKRTTEDFITESIKIHGNKFDYSRAVFTKLSDKVKIICPVHGEFEQRAGGHLNGKGCLKCFHDEVRSRKMSTQEFIRKAKKAHGDTYDYSECEYQGYWIKVKIICRKHGAFLQNPGNHTQGLGCPVCGSLKSIASRRCSAEDFINKARRVHGDKYDYSLVRYESTMKDVELVCPIHGSFTIRPNNHLSSRVGCPVCAAGKNKSCVEFKLKNALNTATGFNWEHGSRKVIPPREVDLFCKDKLIAVEINGEFWHTENKGKNIFYHIGKRNDCENAGVRLLQFTAGEISSNMDLVVSMLRHRCGLFDKKIMARKCTVADVNVDTAKKFCSENHLKGYGLSSVRKGLFLDGELVGLACFVKPRFNKKGFDYELARLCFLQGVVVVGGVSKLIKSIGKGVKVLSYADLRYSNGDSYLKSGFTLLHQSKPNYVWVKNGSIFYSRYECQKHRLKAVLGSSFDPALSERENMEKAGFSRMWDCGNLVFAITT